MSGACKTLDQLTPAALPGLPPWHAQAPPRHRARRTDLPYPTLHRMQARAERLARSLPVAEGEVGEVTGGVAAADADADAGAAAAGEDAPVADTGAEGSPEAPQDPATGAPAAGGERMYALPADSPAATADAAELQHLVRPAHVAAVALGRSRAGPPGSDTMRHFACRPQTGQSKMYLFNSSSTECCSAHSAAWCSTCPYRAPGQRERDITAEVGAQASRG